MGQTVEFRPATVRCCARTVTGGTYQLRWPGSLRWQNHSVDGRDRAHTRADRSNAKGRICRIKFHASSQAGVNFWRKRRNCTPAMAFCCGQLKGSVRPVAFLREISWAFALFDNQAVASNCRLEPGEESESLSCLYRVVHIAHLFMGSRASRPGCRPALLVAFPATPSGWHGRGRSGNAAQRTTPCSRSYPQSLGLIHGPAWRNLTGHGWGNMKWPSGVACRRLRAACIGCQVGEMSEQTEI